MTRGFLRARGALETPDGYKDEGSDYGLKVRGKKAREKINAQCKDILARVAGQGNQKLKTVHSFLPRRRPNKPDTAPVFCAGRSLPPVPR